MELGQILDAVKWFFDSIRTFRLHSIDGAVCLDVFHQLEKIHGRAAQAVREENRRRFRTSLQLQKGWKPRRGWLIQNSRQCSDRRSTINRYRRQLPAADPRDFR